jgi:hypothetical protein
MMIVKGHRTVDEHVSGGGWKGGSHTIEFSGKLNLASESTCVREPKGHVQHVVLVIPWFWQKVVMLRRKNNVTRGAGNGAFTSTCQMCKLVRQIAEMTEMAPSRSISCSCAIERMSSPSLASTVFISCPFGSRKCNLRLKER